MMKVKLLAASVLLVAGSVANAAQVSSGTKILTTACVNATSPILVNDVTLNLSNSVNMGYECLLADATTGTVNRVNVGACHIGGTAKLRSVACVNSGTEEVPVWNVSGCATEGELKEVSGTAMYTASTAGGKIAEAGMATTTCTAAGIAGLVEAIE